MRQVEHHIQDAMEHYAVGVMQQYAERLGLAKAGSSRSHFQDYKKHLQDRGVTASQLADYPEYQSNADKHLAIFVDRLAQSLSPSKLQFQCVEKEARNAGRKEDFLVQVNDKREIPFSLKNYRKSISRAQVSAGTFNSLACSFLFEPAGGVGMFVNPLDGKRFKGSNQSKRDEILQNSSRSSLISCFTKLDTLNDTIKQTFVYSPDFEFLDEDRFDAERKKVGTAGAKAVHDLLVALPRKHVRDVMLRRIGFDGVCEQLLFDPDSYSDSLTVPKFRNLIDKVRGRATLRFGIVGQSIRFVFEDGSEELLSVDIPFTINKNGAWISEEYSGTRFHKKEGKHLASGQRRPKKSRELATSVNTYVNLEGAGILIHS